MRRIIEELVERRKDKQQTLRQTLNDLGNLIEVRGVFKKKKGEINGKLVELNDHINELITAQDREWDAYNNNHSTSIFKSLEWKIEKLEAEYSNVKTLLINFIHLEKSLQQVIESLERNVQPDKETVEKLKQSREQLSTYQYSDFEQRFRGDETKVREKLKKYLPIYAASNQVLDIGCGRGEFMELLQKEGKEVMGIDISESMLQVARDKGFQCSNIDALAYLEKLDENSQGGIFSAQVIEHLEPTYLRRVVMEAFRVLKAESPILLETVNPLSLFALSNIYFLDVTHQKPLHPEYMRYLLESSGFSNVRILYSEELMEEKLVEISPDTPTAREFNTNVDKLNKILFSSPVYAVTGIKT